MDFSIYEVSGYGKLIDFKDRSSDLGLYNLNGSLAFYNSAFTSGTSFAANTLARLVITRDTTNNFFGYVNGVQQISFADSSNLAKFNSTNNISTNNIIHFLRDDFATGGEAAGGVLAKIAIYDGALSAQEVRALGGTNTPINPTPVPTPVLLPGLIGLGLGVLKKRKAEVSKAAIEA